jgi:hypothetical protein
VELHPVTLSAECCRLGVTSGSFFYQLLETVHSFFSTQAVHFHDTSSQWFTNSFILMHTLSLRLTKVAVALSALLFCIWEVSVSNIVFEINYINSGFRDFSQYFQKNAGRVS